LTISGMRLYNSNMSIVLKEGKNERH